MAGNRPHRCRHTAEPPSGARRSGHPPQNTCTTQQTEYSSVAFRDITPTQPAVSRISSGPRARPHGIRGSVGLLSGRSGSSHDRGTSFFHDRAELPPQPNPQGDDHQATDPMRAAYPQQQPVSSSPVNPEWPPPPAYAPVAPVAVDPGTTVWPGSGQGGDGGAGRHRRGSRWTAGVPEPERRLHRGTPGAAGPGCPRPPRRRAREGHDRPARRRGDSPRPPSEAAPRTAYRS